MLIEIQDRSDSMAVLHHVDQIKKEPNKRFHLLNAHIPNMRDWLKSSSIYDEATETNRLKCGVFENILKSDRSLVMISNYLPNCEARLSFDLLTLVLTETELPMVDLGNGMTAHSLGESLLLYNSRIVVIQNGGQIIYILNYEAIMGLDEHINISFEELTNQIDLYDY